MRDLMWFMYGSVFGCVLTAIVVFGVRWLRPRFLELHVTPSPTGKIWAIKEIRAETRCDLSRAKQVAEGSRFILERKTAHRLEARLLKVGASVALRKARARPVGGGA